MTIFILKLKHKWHRLLELYCWLRGHKWSHMIMQDRVTIHMTVICSRCKLSTQASFKARSYFLSQETYHDVPQRTSSSTR